MIKYKLLSKFIRFAVFGLVGTAVHYLVLVMCVELGKIDPVVSSGLGFVFGAITNYYLNYYYTFYSTGKHAVTILKFFIIAVSGLLLNIIIISACIYMLKINYILSQLIATALVLFWNFAFNYAWTFKGKISAA